MKVTASSLKNLTRLLRSSTSSGANIGSGTRDHLNGGLRLVDGADLGFGLGFRTVGNGAISALNGSYNSLASVSRSTSLRADPSSFTISFNNGIVNRLTILWASIFPLMPILT